jgi:hypothetical protein
VFAGFPPVAGLDAFQIRTRRQQKRRSMAALL